MTSSRKAVLVIGESGQLSCSVAKIAAEFPDLYINFSNRRDLDLTNLESIHNYLSSNHCDVIINAAAYTAVDQAEAEPEIADLINHQAVKKLSEAALQQDCILIHVSTDYVFDGGSSLPYKEEDPTNPISVYGKTKLLGEQEMRHVSPKGCIIRTSWLYSEFGNNFVNTMLRMGKERNELRVVNDQIGSPTYAVDLARAILMIVQSETLSSTVKPQLYHYTNDGVCSWYEFAIAVFQIAQLDCKVNPILSSEYSVAATRPHYSVLNKEKVKKEFGLKTEYWRTSLMECLRGI